MKREDYLVIAKKLNKNGGADPIVGGGLPEHYSGELTVVKVSPKTEKVQGNDWLPVECTDSEGNSVRVSIMRFVGARGLKWKSQYLADRLAAIQPGLSVDVNDYVWEDATGTNGAYKRKTLVCSEQQMPEPTFEDGAAKSKKKGK